MGRSELDNSVRTLLAATSAVGGQRFFEELARATAEALGMRWALVGLLLPGNTRVRTLAAWDSSHAGGGWITNFEYPLTGTPCANVTEQGPCQYLAGVAAAFPEDTLLTDMGAASYAGVPIPSHDGKVIGVLAALDDRAIETFSDLEARLGVFAARAGMEIERVQMQEDLQRAQKMELLGQLAGGIVHDLNNMVGPILGLSEFLLEDLAGTPHEPSLRDIHEAALRSRALVRSLLAFARREATTAGTSDAVDVLTRFEPMLRRMASRSIDLVFELGPRGRVVPIDAHDLEQVIANLVINARDACSSRPGRVVVRCHGDERQLLLSVSDNGAGMEPSVLARAFEPFFTTKREGGTGLGLASARTVLQRAGGSIGVESTVGAGTTFELRFPVVR